TVVLHIVLVYVIATGLGVIPKPSPPLEDLKYVNLPLPVQRVEPKQEEHVRLPVSKRIELPPIPDDPPIKREQNPPPPTEGQDQSGTEGRGSGVILPEPTLFEPHLARSFEPPYPRPSILQKEEGVVRVRVTISPYGEVGEARIEKSSGFPRL